MNKFIKTLLFILPTFALTSCGENNAKCALTFGQDYDSLEDVFDMEKDSTYTNFLYATQNKESFVAILYNSYTCSCYLDLRLSAREYLFDNNIDVFAANVSIFDNSKSNFGISFPNATSYPIIALFKNGNLSKQINYSRTESAFTSKDAFKNLIEENYYLPKIIHTSYEKLENYYETKEKFLVLFRQESCSDCAALSQNILQYYFTNNYSNLNSTEFYMIDKDYDFKGFEWPSIKDQFGLSNVNNSLGYETGYVPTIQEVESGVCKSMAVYLNDKIVDNVVERTYYTDEIISAQDYLMENNISSFLGEKINSEKDIFDYHNNVMNLFLNYFLIG